MRLITEQSDNIEYIEEAVGNSKHHVIHGIFLQSNIKNRNGRIYPPEIMENEVNRYIKEMIASKRSFGELSHPSGPTINLDRVSHLITELKKDGTDYYGKARIIDTPMGGIVKGILSSGGKIGVSSRGLGTLKPLNDGIMEVQNDFKLATAADIVHDPSAPNAFVAGIMEGVEWVYDPVKDTWLEEKVNKTKRLIKKMSKRQLDESKLWLFNNFIKDISKL